MNKKKTLHLICASLCLMLVACGQAQDSAASADEQVAATVQTEESKQSNEVTETIMSRRSIRKYKPIGIEQKKLEKILECGINAPNGMYKQSWELRVINTPAMMNQIAKAYENYQKKNGRKRISHPSFGAPCLVFIAYDTTYDLSQVDCGLLGENIILSAQSMNLGTCCLGGIARFMNSPDAKDLLEQLSLPSSHKLLYAIAIGYPDEKPAAKSRDLTKIKYIK